MSAAVLSAAPSPRQRLAQWVEGPRVQRLVIALILVNAVTLGLETSAWVMERWGGLIQRLDQAILAVFVAEIALRLAARGWAFFRDPWGVFDFLVIAIALLPATGPFAVLRALRVLRVLRLFSLVPEMRRVVGALLAAVPGLGSIALILLLLFYVFGVIATKLFGAAFPAFFGDLGASMYTLFQVMTLESWSAGVVRPVMEVFPLAWLFFIPFILVTTFTMLNLFIAIIVNAMQSEALSREEASLAHVDQVVDRAAKEVESLGHADVESLRAEIRELRALILAGRPAPAAPRDA